MLYQNEKIAGRVNFLIVREQPYLMKNSKFFSAFLFPLFAIALLVSTIQSLSAIERPNVLLITADDLGIQLSCYGDPIANTPHIDALAARSVRFKTAYVSQASCSPSRSTMFTGLYPHGNGHYGLANANVGFRVHEWLIDALLPNVLKRAGYRTGIIGKLHVDPEERFQFDFRTNEGFGARDIRKQIQFARDYLNTDPEEFHNLLAQHSSESGDGVDENSWSDVESRLKTALAKWQRETDDPFDDAEFRRHVQEKHRAGN